MSEWPEELGDPATVYERFHLRVELTRSQADEFGPALFAEATEALVHGQPTLNVERLLDERVPEAKRFLAPGPGRPEFVVVDEVTGEELGRREL